MISTAGVLTYPRSDTGTSAQIVRMTVALAPDTLLSFDAARINLIEGGGYARLAASGSDSGHLIYARSEGLMAVPFDAQRLKATGTAVPILEDVVSNLSGGAHYSVSGNGTLAYHRGVRQVTVGAFGWVMRALGHPIAANSG